MLVAPFTPRVSPDADASAEHPSGPAPAPEPRARKPVRELHIVELQEPALELRAIAADLEAVAAEMSSEARLPTADIRRCLGALNEQASRLQLAINESARVLRRAQQEPYR